MSFTLIHCLECKYPSTDKSFTKCSLCGKQPLCFECTIAPHEVKELFEKTGKEKIWSPELEKSDPDCKEGGGLVGMVCRECYRLYMKKEADVLALKYRNMLQRIHEEVLLGSHGEVYRKFARHLPREEGGEVEVYVEEQEEHQAPTGLLPPEPECEVRKEEVDGEPPEA